MAKKKAPQPPKPIWAYSYELVPPQAEDRLHPIKNVLDRKQEEARRGARTWVGSVVVKRQVTHILVVSDSPAQDLEINRSLEAKLTELETGFAITVPMRVADEAKLGGGHHLHLLE